MTNDTHIDAVGYALDAVDDLERARSERHLQDCESCRREVAEVAELTVTLASDIPPVAPSPDLRSALLEQIQHTPQVSQSRADRPGHARTSARTSRPRRAVIGLVAAGAVVVAGAGVIHAQPWANTSGGVTNAMSRIEHAPDATRRTMPFRGGTVTVISSRSLNQAVATLHKVTASTGDTTYQGWFIKGDGPTNAGILKTGHTNQLTANVQGAKEFDITIEPTGGSQVPTKTPILAMPLT
ncbi:anti-sigma factor domain-containing protein [Allobranchiibius sp. CTAmp26]|uniref:anti-sigma factor n=1 Tax=Allobranchiibius sp. CTAmp26 TaxID=2815214 RepID=UPI001AA0D860|nr:anti-sigma factor [Allobranchiibius sp. CTAmp26]MBO1756363.1 anti-sigma factor [Allobranchiibius sp. CTAmp26]